MFTCATPLIIFEPPEAPEIIFTLPSLSIIIVGDMDDNGLLPGLIKFASDGMKP